MRPRLPSIAVAFAGVVLAFGSAAFTAGANPAASQGTTLPATAPSSQPSDVWLWVQPDRAEALYRAGEVVRFDITGLKSKQPIDGPIEVELFEDGVSKSKRSVTLEHGKASVEATLDRPGFVRCQARMGDDFASGAAGFDVDDIRTVTPEPADFDAFWARQREALARVPMDLKLTPVDSGDPAVLCFEVEAKSALGLLRGYLARPARADRRKYPALVTVRGGGVFDSQKSVAIAWARVGLVVLDWNIHGLEHNRGKAYYQQLREGDLNDYYTRGCQDREAIYFRGVILRMVRAIDVVCAQPEWDGAHLIVSGASQGGGLAIIAGGLDPRVSLIVAQVPGMCDLAGSLGGRANGWPRFISNDPGTRAEPNVLAAIGYYEATHFAKRYAGESLLTVGFLDRSCFPTGAFAAFNALRGPKRMLHLPWLGHTFSEPGQRAEWEAIARHAGLQ